MDDLTRIQPVKRTSLALRSESTGKLHELVGEMLVGREVECDIQLNSPRISRYHAKLFVSANGLYLEDLGSSNGTFINGQQVRHRSHIGLGDQISFDSVCYRVTTSRSGNADDTILVAPPELLDRPVEKAPRSLRSALGSSASQVSDTPHLPNKFGDDQKHSLESEINAYAAGSKIGTSAGIQTPSANLNGAAASMQEPSDDMKEFLEFAASGLKAQTPLSRQEASPFGIGANDIKSSDSPPGNQGLVQNEISGHDEIAGPDLLSSEAKSTIPEHVADRLVPEQESSVEVLEEDLDADRTRHIGLNAMDQYAETNEKHQQDLDAGSGPRIIAMTAPIRGKLFELRSDDNVTCWSIGRDDKADICIRDPAVSREHAWITKLESLYQLRVSDNASEVIINGKAQTDVELQHGDRLQFGAMELVFRLNQSEPSDTVTSDVGWIVRVKSFLKRLW
ncbi:FHA domain-containing protein [Agarilytica rhodophyticola]|uniref:FHA domain-containing protein n=1 Tax=Agarilytica rhodophyticola TaxID=1737490 RepID=UPI000B3454B4|nr:FHA domain-containing protein [Agarilytica rhodophyticola]